MRTLFYISSFLLLLLPVSCGFKAPPLPPEESPEEITDSQTTNDINSSQKK